MVKETKHESDNVGVLAGSHAPAVGSVLAATHHLRKHFCVDGRNLAATLASHGGWWQWFNSPNELAAYLRYAGLSDLIDNKFDRRSVDDSFREIRIDARQMLDLVLAKSYRTEDIPSIAGILDPLEAAISLPTSEAEVVVAEICHSYIMLCGTGSWFNQSITLFTSPVEVAQRIIDDNCAPEDQKAWLALATAATINSQAAANFCRRTPRHSLRVVLRQTCCCGLH